jgi:hypothetical protein
MGLPSPPLGRFSPGQRRLTDQRREAGLEYEETRRVAGLSWGGRVAYGRGIWLTCW